MVGWKTKGCKSQLRTEKVQSVNDFAAQQCVQKRRFARRSTRPFSQPKGRPESRNGCSIGAKASPENSCLYAGSHRS
jgi:hypothetical protein